MGKKTIIWTLLVLGALSLQACAAPSVPFLAQAEPTSTPRPTRTPRPTSTPEPTNTPSPTASAAPTNTPVPPTATPPPPTKTPPPTETPRPAAPRPTNTPLPPQAPPPTATPSTEFTGAEVDVRGAYKCGATQGILVAVVDRQGKALPGYYVHIGKDGSFSRWVSYATTNQLKDLGKGFGYNAEFNTGPSNPYYITVFRQPTEPFNINLKISNEVRVRVDEKDEAACGASEGNDTGGRILIAAVRFVFNR